MVEKGTRKSEFHTTTKHSTIHIIFHINTQNKVLPYKV
ncbi:hypothetical protein J2Y40_000668 [Chryseobacterium sp. 2987]|nr:hypothetical protein [Chryseobacterium sp. 2987]